MTEEEELVKKLKDENLSLEEQIKYRGELIRVLKQEMKNTDHPKVLASLRLTLYNELKVHKEKLKELEKSKNISIPKKVGLKVKEIANTIDIFKEKIDFNNKIKNTAISTAVGSLFAGALTVGLSAIGGVPITLATLASVAPIMCYTGLTGILKMPFTETSWTKMIKNVDTSETDKNKIIKFMDNYVKNNKKLLELLQRKVNTKDENELLEINNGLIEEYKGLIDRAPINELKRMFVFEKINLLNEQKKIYERIKKDYIKHKRELSLSEFAELEKKLVATNMSITAEGTYFKDVLKKGGKDLAVSAGALVAAKAILGKLFPGLAITDLASLSIPLIYSLLGTAANLGEIRNQIELEKEAYDKLKTNITPEKLKEFYTLDNTESLKIA